MPRFEPVLGAEIPPWSVPLQTQAVPSSSSLPSSVSWLKHSLSLCEVVWLEGFLWWLGGWVVVVFWWGFFCLFFCGCLSLVVLLHIYKNFIRG